MFINNILNIQNRQKYTRLLEATEMYYLTVIFIPH